jgi:hypothetical protein
VTESPPAAPDLGEPPRRVALRKNLWFWAIVACLVFPPCIRPFTRDIVEAPVATSAAVSPQLQGRGGIPFGAAELEERIHIAFFVDASGETCPEAIEMMRPLVERMDIQAYAGRGMLARKAGFGEDIRVLVFAGFPSDEAVDLAGLERRCAMDSDRWVLAGAALPALELLGAQLEGRPGEATTFISHRRSAILDTERRARGLYGMDELGLDEVYHRARHVLRDDRIEIHKASEPP